jgi:hypothetical protein
MVLQLENMKRPPDQSCCLRLDTTRPVGECAAEALRAAVPCLFPGTPMPGSDMLNCAITEIILQPAPHGITGKLVIWSAASHLAP